MLMNGGITITISIAKIIETYQTKKLLNIIETTIINIKFKNF